MSTSVAAQRFWAKVDKSGDCWLWTGALAHGVYGNFWDGQRNVPAHAFSYEQEHGPVPAGHELDHRPTCPKRCVHPDHTRPATRKQNMENQGSVRAASGVRGVTWHRGAWCGQVMHNGRNYYCGRHATVELAEAAVIAKRLELFTHNDLDRIAV